MMRWRQNITYRKWTRNHLFSSRVLFSPPTRSFSIASLLINHQCLELSSPVFVRRVLSLVLTSSFDNSSVSWLSKVWGSETRSARSETISPMMMINGARFTASDIQRRTRNLLLNIDDVQIGRLFNYSILLLQPAVINKYWRVTNASTSPHTRR